MKQILAVIFVLCAVRAGAQALYFPPLSGNTWETISPASLGWNSAAIDSLYSFLELRKSKAFIVLKDGKIVLEKYFGTYTADSLWYWASAGKTVTSFMVGMAQYDGLFKLTDSTSKFLGAGWTSEPREKEGKITILNQLTMTSGLKDNVPDPYCTLPSCLLYAADAGTRWAYHNAPYTLLDSVIIKSSGQSYNLYYATKLRNRIGMNGAWLPSGYNNTLYTNPRSMARFGLLILNKGIWSTDTLMKDTSYFRRMTTTSQNINPSYGYLFWLNGKSSYMLPQTQFVFQGMLEPSAPADMISALGKDGQILNIVPGMRLVMLRMGEKPDSSLEVPTYFNDDIWKKFNKVLPPVSIESATAQRAHNFILYPAYPNPFNPAVTVSYKLSEQCPVKIELFNAVSESVAVLYEGEQQAGTHFVNYNGSKLASGMYLIRVRAGGAVKLQKICLLK